MSTIVNRVLCRLGFHAPRHHRIGGDVLSTCAHCDWMRKSS